MKKKLINYVPAPDHIMLDEPIVEEKLNASSALIKTEAAIKKEKADWVTDGKPLKVAKDFTSSNGQIIIPKGSYIQVKNMMGVVHISFEEGDKWQLPITSYAGHFLE